MSSFFFESTTYWSEGDERAHFEWLDRIAAIKQVRGEGRRVYIDIDEAKLTKFNLVELEAIYRRYNGDVAQLSALRTTENS